MTRQQVQKIAQVLVTAVAILVIVPIIFVILFMAYNGLGALSWEFITQPPRDGMTQGGVWPALLGTIFLTFGTAIAAMPLGIGAAIYLAEYAGDNWLTRVIRLAIVNLAGIPSIVYGLFGLGAFVLFLNFGTSILAGSLTLGLMTLPVVISTAEEAILAVPKQFRTVSLSLGATRWQTIRNQVLPHALPGIITGAILGLGRAAGETAPILFTVAAFYLPE
ncbi:MAG: phosphate ABC transporter permease PstA, partial [Anaerolineales bacterium]|nr:phosphate ABC transporter permease PstA [Anaerolineales bacterium]